MIKSMTGYGKAERTVGHGRIVVEIRSLNHRYGEVTVKLPRRLLPLENEVRNLVAERLKRGKIDLFVQLEGGAAEAALPVPDVLLARAYYDALVCLKEALNLPEPISLGLIAAQKDVLVSGEGDLPVETLRPDLLIVSREAVESLDRMRQREGEALLKDILSRRGMLGELSDRVGRRAPAAVGENMRRMKERVAQLADESGVDEGRLAQEIAIMADRCDVSEELTRFSSHLQQFDETLNMAESVGRKLDFLIQELNREVNTIGSKANDAEIAAMVVELKAVLEKIREQVQNVE
ncbi:MAG: YicC/YloC family endoribonuclease [Geobacteraceae bacterium]